MVASKDQRVPWALQNPLSPVARPPDSACCPSEALAISNNGCASLECKNGTLLSFTAAVGREPHQGGVDKVRGRHSELRQGGAWVRPCCVAQDRPALHLPGAADSIEHRPQGTEQKTLGCMTDRLPGA
eukprot:1158127-Pelagomonas_calceolata.AAC.17